ncbi:MAG: hypothetical protein MJZ25_06075 [Fibrobacter sp.]|nr:hypothetical protein [Fibrobacter sp.]
MKYISSKIVLALSSVALMAAMSACTADSSAGTTSDLEEVGWNSPSKSDVDKTDDGVVSSSSVAPKSSSSAVVESSSSEETSEPESSGSEEAEEEFDPEIGAIEEDMSKTPEKVNDRTDKVVAITPEKIEESMTKVDEDKVPEGIEKDEALTGDDLFVGDKDLDFDENEYYCKTPEGDWYVLEGSKYDNFWSKFLNWMSILFTGKKWLDYSKVCEVIYVHPNR